jgi:hypothetical protein
MKDFTNEIKAFLYGLMVYLQIDKDVSQILILLILATMFFGSLKAVLLKELSFSMDNFWGGLKKKLLLLALVMMVALLARGLGFQDFKLMVTTVMKIMILNEGISIFNSIRSIYDGKEYKSNDFISLLIDKISNYLIIYMNKLLKFFDNTTKCD